MEFKIFKRRLRVSFLLRALVLDCSKSEGRNFDVSTAYSKYSKFRRFDGVAVRKALAWIYHSPQESGCREILEKIR